MKNTGVVGVIAVVLLLSGCAASPSAAPVEETSSSPVAEAPVETAAPLEAAEPTTAQPSADDSAYLSEVRLRLQSLPEATDEQLVAAAAKSCEMYAQGQGKFDQRLIDGEAADINGIYADSTVIATWAATVYCPEFS